MQYSGSRNTVRVERQHVVAIRHNNIWFRRRCWNQHPAARRLDHTVPATHQTKIRVKVHRLIRLVRKRRELLSLEVGDFRLKDPHEPCVQLANTASADSRIRFVRSGPHRSRGCAKVFFHPLEEFDRQELVAVINVRERNTEVAKPANSVLVVPREEIQRIDVGRLHAIALVGEGPERRFEPPPRFGE